MNKVLVGVVSWGVSLASWGPPSLNPFLPQFPTVYASVAAQVSVNVSNFSQSIYEYFFEKLKI